MSLKTQSKRNSASLPMRMIAISFALVIIAGTFLLMLPISSNDGQPTNFLDCLFTATSSTCVTGLVVFDTYLKWSAFGKIVILLLIQIGGLGLITFTTFFNVAIGRKLGLRNMQLAQESLNSTTFFDVTHLVKAVVLISLAMELCGAAILCTTFVPKYGAEGIFISIFMSVSAFCNAGFDLLGMEGEYVSLCNYNGSPVVIFTISLLIIIGGLGFLVWKDIFTYRKTKILMLHTKIVLIMTITLILSGMFLFLILEWNNPDTLGGLPVADRFTAAFFQSVTLRTAGFNSVDVNSLHSLTKLGSIVLMFIGAAPGSTAGGVKVTTFAVIVMTVVSVIRGKDDTIILKRRVQKNVVYKALAVVSIALLVVCVSSITIYFTNPDHVDVTGINALFESVSAFGTVGISSGVTAVANIPSKIILILTMYIGRVGPVSLALALAMRGKPPKDVIVPDGKILVG